MRYNRIDPRFWMDRAVRAWTDDAKLLALYLLTSPHRTTEGLFRLPKAYMQADLQWSPEQLAKPFAELLGQPYGEPGFIAYDADAEVVLIRNALKYQPLQNDNQVTSALNSLDELPPNHLTCEFRQLAERHCERLAKRLPEGFGQPIPEPPAPAPAPAPKNEGANAPVAPAARPVSVDRQVFDFWREARAKNGRVEFSDARKRAVAIALKAYPLEDLLDAIRGIAADERRWPDRALNDDLLIALRLGGRGNRNNLEYFRDLYRLGGGPRERPPLMPEDVERIVPEEEPLPQELLPGYGSHHGDVS